MFKVNLIVNGNAITIVSPANRTLLEVIREDLGLTGAKDACGGEGECGACTVLLDGNPVNACMVLIGQVDGCQIETIEGLSTGDQPHPIQKAFVEAGAVQCGYCTPGVIMASKALLVRNPYPNNEEIREALAGNLCRCTGYSKIIDAIHRAAEEMSHAN